MTVPSVDRETLMSDVRDTSQRTAPETPVGDEIASDRFLAAIIESSDDAIISKTLDGTITSWNHAAEQLYGYTPEEAIGQPISIIIPTDRPDELPSIMARLRRGKRIEHFETIRVRKDGTRLDISVSISPIRDHAGQIVGAASIGRDITERQRATRERNELEQRAQEAARLSEAALRETGATLEIINRVGKILTAELDLETLVQGVTDAATSLTGAQFGAFFYNALDERGEYYMLYAISGAPREAFTQFPMPRNTALFSPTFCGKGAVRRDDVRQDPLYGQNAPYYGMPEGHLPVASYLAVPVIGRAGEILGGLFFGHPEVGVFGQRAEQLAEGLAAQAAVAVENARLFQQAQRELAARRHIEAEQEAFLNSVAHDMGNPLTTIKGQSQLLQRRIKRGHLDASNLETALLAIERATDRASRLITELADVARLSAERPLELDRTNTDLVQLARDTLATYVGGAQHRLELEATDTLLTGSWDANRLTRVLENLLANAVKYSPPGSTITVRVHRETTADGEMAALMVTDRGIGIPAADLPSIMERFHRGRNVAGRIAGTGIGLWGSRRIVEQHGGSITLESAEGQGTTVIVRLPLG
jgi:PAS domain S-box-containing protein